MAEEEKRTRRVRRTVSAQAPGPPAQTIGVDAGLLADLAGKVGDLTGEVRGLRGEVKGINNRMQRFEEAAQEQAVKNASVHGEMKAEMRALGATVAGLVADKHTPPPGGASEGRKEAASPLKVWGEVFSFVKTWWPGLVALAAAVYAWFEKKGGPTSP